MIRVIRIPQDEAVPLEDVTLRNFTAMQTAVGGYIEFVDIEQLHASLVVDENGKVYGKPLNRRATLLYWMVESSARMRDAIAGDVIIVGEADRDGNSTDVPATLVELLLGTKCFKAEFQTFDDADRFNGNLRRFTNYFEAANYALLKSQAWMAVENVRVVPAEDAKDCA